jgi:hypothetical protein
MRLAIFALLFFLGAVTITPSVVAIVVGLCAPVLSYIIAARRFSGKIETTEAKDLWAESKAIRDWSRERIEALEARVLLLEKENRELRAQLRGKVNV